VITVDAEGFRTGIGTETPSEYHADPCQHPSISSHTAMRLLKCPEDVMRTHPKLGGSYFKREYSDSMDNGNVIDQLLTGKRYAPSPKFSHAAVGANGKDLKACEYERFESLLIVDADAWSSNSAKGLKEIARAQDKTPILRSDFEKEIGKVPEYLARLELAGVSLEGVRTQVPVFWVEQSSEGRKVQCRALLDVFSEDDLVITDLKTTDDLSDSGLARSIFRWNYHVQGAVYQRAIYKALDLEVAPPVRLAFLRTRLPAARAEFLAQDWLYFGSLLWAQAVDVWAECLSTGHWPGHEMREERIVPEHYMIQDMKRQLGVE
jgi:hypothetical protein